MAEITRYIKHRRDTAANWTSNNPILKAGQLGIETDGLTTTPKFKIGDGVTAWTGLPYFYGGTASAQDLANVLSLGGSATSLALKNVISDETGSGSLVFGTSPTFVTDITTPLIIGGTTNNSYLTYKATTGTGVSADPAHIFTGGANGGTEIMRLLNGGKVGIGTIPTGAGYLQVNSNTTDEVASFTSSDAIAYLSLTDSTGTAYVGTGSTGRLFLGSTASISSNNLVIMASGNGMGYGITFPSITGLHIQKTAEQLRLAYDASNYLSTTITSTGIANFVATGTSAGFNIGNYATPSAQRLVTIGQDTAYVSIGSLVGTTSSWALYGNNATPSATNPFLYGTNNDTYLNAGVSAGRIYTQVGGNTVFTLGADRFIAVGLAQSSGAITNFTFTVPANTGQTASTEIPNFKVTGNTKTWAAGAITTQRWNYLTANTAAFASASTITNSYGLYVEAATAGTNTTITNNYAAGFSGSIVLATNNTALYGIDTIGTRRVLIDFTSGDNININGRPGTTDININPTSGGVGLIVKGNTGDTGLGAATPSARCHIIKTTEQLRVGYDASNYAAHTVGAAGSLTIGLTGTTPELYFNNTGGVVIGNKAALATTATDGFLYVPSCAGLPTGVPTAKTGKIAVVVDSTNNKMYIYSGGAWVALN